MLFVIHLLRSQNNELETKSVDRSMAANLIWKTLKYLNTLLFESHTIGYFSWLLVTLTLLDNASAISGKSFPTSVNLWDKLYTIFLNLHNWID